MEMADKLVNLTIVTACVAVALGLIAGTSYSTAPSADVALFHGAISSAALRPARRWS